MKKTKFTFKQWEFLNDEVQAIEAYLRKTHQRFLRSTVLHEAQGYAAKNYPGLADDSFESCLTTLRAFYTSLKSEVAARLQGGIQKRLGAANVATANQNIKNKEAELQYSSDGRDHLISDRRRIFVDGDHDSYKKQRALLTVFAIGECLWMASAFLKLGDIVLIALFLGIVIGLAQISAVKTAVQIIKEISDGRKRKFYSIVAAVSFITISWLLALLRFWFIHIGSGSGVPFIVMNPLTFAAINLLFIGATALIVIFHYPTRSQIKEMNDVEKLDKKIADADCRCGHLNNELVQLVNDREFMVELRLRIDHAENHLKQNVATMFDEAVGIFKNENIAKRPDKGFPISFKNAHQPLSTLEEMTEEVHVMEN